MRLFKHLVLVAGLALGACAMPGVDVTSLPMDQQVFVLKSDYEAQLDVLRAYREQPRCSAAVVVGCYDPEVYALAVAAAVRADEALDVAEAAVNAGSADSAAQIRAARAALNALINSLAARSV